MLSFNIKLFSYLFAPYFSWIGVIAIATKPAVQAYFCSQSDLHKMLSRRLVGISAAKEGFGEEEIATKWVGQKRRR